MWTNLGHLTYVVRDEFAICSRPELTGRVQRRSDSLGAEETLSDKNMQ